METTDVLTKTKMVIAANMMFDVVSDCIANSSRGGFFTQSLSHEAWHKKNA